MEYRWSVVLNSICDKTFAGRNQLRIFVLDRLHLMVLVSRTSHRIFNVNGWFVFSAQRLDAVYFAPSDIHHQLRRRIVRTHVPEHYSDISTVAAALPHDLRLNGSRRSTGLVQYNMRRNVANFVIVH